MIQNHLYRISKSFSRENLYEFLTNSIINNEIIRYQHLLNIGSGGEISDHLRKLNLTFVSIDIDPSRSPDIVMDVMEMDKFPESSIDVVFCMEVLEHVKDPFKACKEIKRVLRPNGLIVGSTPFILGIHDAPFDFFRFTSHGIKELFKDFEQIELKNRNKYFHSIFTLVLRLYVVSSKRDKIIMKILFPFIMLSYPIIWILDKLIISKDVTTGYFFIFRKID